MIKSKSEGGAEGEQSNNNNNNNSNINIKNNKDENNGIASMVGVAQIIDEAATNAPVCVAATLINTTTATTETISTTIATDNNLNKSGNYVQGEQLSNTGDRNVVTIFTVAPAVRNDAASHTSTSALPITTTDTISIATADELKNGNRFRDEQITTRKTRAFTTDAESTAAAALSNSSNEIGNGIVMVAAESVLTNYDANTIDSSSNNNNDDNNNDINNKSHKYNNNNNNYNLNNSKNDNNNNNNNNNENRGNSLEEEEPLSINNNVVTNANTITIPAAVSPITNNTSLNTATSTINTGITETMPVAAQPTNDSMANTFAAAAAAGGGIAAAAPAPVNCSTATTETISRGSDNFQGEQLSNRSGSNAVITIAVAPGITNDAASVPSASATATTTNNVCTALNIDISDISNSNNDENETQATGNDNTKNENKDQNTSAFSTQYSPYPMQPPPYSPPQPGFQQGARPQQGFPQQPGNVAVMYTQQVYVPQQQQQQQQRQQQFHHPQQQGYYPHQQQPYPAQYPPPPQQQQQGYYYAQQQPYQQHGYNTQPYHDQQRPGIQRAGSSVDNRRVMYQPGFGDYVMMSTVVYVECFEDPKVRQAFIQKVYSIVTLQLILCFGWVFVCAYVEPVNKFHKDYPQLLLLALILFMISSFSVACCCWQAFVTHPTDVILLLLQTVLLSFMAGAISVKYKPEVVLMAFGTSIGLLLILTLLAFQTRYDFTKWTGVLFIAVMVTLVFALVGGIMLPLFFSVRVKILHLVISCVMVIFMCGYIVIDTQMLMRNKEYSLEPYMYCFAAYQIFADVVILFLHLLRIFDYLND